MKFLTFTRASIMKMTVSLYSVRAAGVGVLCIALGVVPRLPMLQALAVGAVCALTVWHLAATARAKALGLAFAASRTKTVRARG